MLKGIFEDAVSRGEVPTLIIGVFNMQISECDYLSSLACAGWLDIVFAGYDGLDNSRTSHKGQGSRVYLGFVNKSASVLMSTYEVRNATIDSDHSAFSVCMSHPVGAQVRYIARSVGRKLEYV